jgi:hypothetical protein
MIYRKKNFGNLWKFGYLAGIWFTLRLNGPLFKKLDFDCFAVASTFTVILNHFAHSNFPGMSSDNVCAPVPA